MIVVILQPPQSGRTSFMAEGGDPATLRHAVAEVLAQIDEQFPDLAAPEAIKKPAAPKSNLLLPPHLLPPNGR